MYGSRLSTRMQEGAKSVWKASKHFASSVVTGGVSLSACRKHQVSQPVARRDAPEEPVSVVQVTARDEQGQTEPSPEAPRDLVVRVDGNNKLTIVTKFNEATVGAEHSPTGAALSSASSSSSGSERSRCESSSSGRGTASETGSAAPSHDEESSNKPVAQEEPRRPAKGRKLFKASKMIKSGSQVSLNKLKTFLMGNSDSRKLKLANKTQIDLAAEKPAATTTATAIDSELGERKQSTCELQTSQDLEIARIRCLELNQAINVASMAPATEASKEDTASSVPLTTQ